MPDETIYDVKDRVQWELVKLPGVHAVSVGMKTVNGKKTKVLAIRVHVVKKILADQVPADQLIPTEIEGHPVDVVEQPQVSHLADTREAATDGPDTKYYRPLQGGSQLQFTKGGYSYNGTLGCFVQSAGGTTVFVLTNQHVVDGAPDKTIGQPNNRAKSCCCGTNSIGKVVKAVKNKNVDAATVGIGDIKYDLDILGIGKATGTHTVMWYEFDDQSYPVRKSGRTTGVTRGVVVSTTLSGYSTGRFWYENQVDIHGIDMATFAEGGDSGAVVVNVAEEVVGLLWAGAGGFGVASPIAEVLSALSVEVVTSSPSAEADTERIVFDYEAMQKNVESQLSASEEGREFLQVYNDNQEQVQTLIETNKRVTVVWHRNHGPDLLTILQTGVQNADQETPTEVDGDGIQNCMENILGILMEFGDQRLQNAILKLQTEALSHVGQSWNQFLAGLK